MRRRTRRCSAAPGTGSTGSVDVRARAHLDPRATVVLLDARGRVADEDAAALRTFVAAGGRLVVGGAAGVWLDRIVPRAPDWSPTPVEQLRTLAPSPQLARVRRLEHEARARGSAARRCRCSANATVRCVALASVGTGRVWLLADASPLQNRLLAEADDAALGLALAGPARVRSSSSRAIHGYGAADGFAAVPGRWWTAFGLLALATLVLMIASGRRFGPPQASERELPPPRRAYVEALGTHARAHAVPRRRDRAGPQACPRARRRARRARA